MARRDQPRRLFRARGGAAPATPAGPTPTAARFRDQIAGAIVRDNQRAETRRRLDEGAPGSGTLPVRATPDPEGAEEVGPCPECGGWSGHDVACTRLSWGGINITRVRISPDATTEREKGRP